jgi:hypothetical protein
MIKAWIATILLTVVLVTPDLATPDLAAQMKAGEESGGPWWMRETALKRDGSIMRFSEQSWWERARALSIGESFVVPASGEAAGRMLVRRERLEQSTYRGARNAKEAFVLIIDDDGDGSAAEGGDKDSDCYVVDYDCDGIIDRMVDYIDNDGDGDMDELDIRYFTAGRLNWAWFGDDVDDDNVIRNVTAYERGDEFKGDPYGDNFFYMNKFKPGDGVWTPISECPFAFYDIDGDGYSEIVVRVAAVPMTYSPTRDPDYANTAYSRPWDTSLDSVAIGNIRYSFDVDRGSSAAFPLHYDMSFKLAGLTPYSFPGMRRLNAKRRPPQETTVIPWKDVRSVADHFNARETGFSWNENSDDTVANGADPTSPFDYRWEGIFWTWERRPMANTGNPVQKWNMRREWRGRPADKRELYYSGVDRRIHLVGAEEGWIEIGHFSGLGTIGEIRMFDTDHNGFFDRWEVYLGEDPQPVRVSTVRNERARLINVDVGKLTTFYADTVLPGAIADRTKLMKAMGDVHPFQLPEKLKQAMNTGSESYRRYAMDVACELQYNDFRSSLMRRADEMLRGRPAPARDRSEKEMRRTESGLGEPAYLDHDLNGPAAWRLTRALSELDAAYGQGNTKRACAAIDEIKRIFRTESDSKSIE